MNNRLLPISKYINNKFMTPILNDIQKKKADFIMANKYAKLSLLASSEIKDLAVVWCYYSGKIEGNTYTYVETEALLKDNITSEKRYEDAKMLKNLYNTFVSEEKHPIPCIFLHRKFSIHFLFQQRNDIPPEPVTNALRKFQKQELPQKASLEN